MNCLTTRTVLHIWWYAMSDVRSRCVSGISCIFWIRWTVMKKLKSPCRPGHVYLYKEKHSCSSSFQSRLQKNPVPPLGTRTATHARSDFRGERGLLKRLSADREIKKRGTCGGQSPRFYDKGVTYLHKQRVSKKSFTFYIYASTARERTATCISYVT